MALKFGSSDVSELKIGSQAVSAVYLGADRADAGGGGGGAYVAKAVTFPRSVEVDRSTGAASFNKFTVMLWGYEVLSGFNLAQVIFGGQSGINITPNNNSDGSISVTIDAGGGNFVLLTSTAGVFTPDSWRNQIFLSADLDHPAGEKVFRLLVNGVDVLDPAQTVDNSGAFSVDLPGTGYILPDFTGEPHPTSYADVQVWYGTAIDPTGHIDKIITADGKPVDPAITAAQFGQQSDLLSGDKDTFLTNQGGSGVDFVARYQMDADGRNGAGSITLPSVQLGASLISATYFDGGLVDLVADFEPTISVAGHIQQTSSDDLSSRNIHFTLTAFLTNATTSPSD